VSFFFGFHPTYESFILGLSSNLDYDEALVPKLLLFYYLLLYEEKRRETISALPNSMLTNKLAWNKNSFENILKTPYSTEIFDYITINFLLLKAKSAGYFVIYPQVLKLFTNLFPQLCQVQHGLYDIELKLHKWKSLDEMKSLIVELKNSASQEASTIITRSKANSIKLNWFRAYSIYGRK
jgi:hypothetical protein